ncbi:MAG: hypothetical protein Ta2B_07620 [Termitinemataceae bacterium]|nr:MAG: hypothetical protein Ta2B_07620 [Termitinemataceae bacterium]
MKKQKTKKTLIKIACVMGLFVFLTFLGLFIYSGFLERLNIFGGKNDLQSANYSELIQRFDLLLNDIAQDIPVNPVFLKNLLAALQAKSVGAESHISVLKRYRVLAKTYNEYIYDYFNLVEIASEKFQHSALLSVLRAEALIWESTALSEDGKAQADYAKRNAKLINLAQVLVNNGPLSANTFFPIAFSIYAASGSFDTLDSTQQVNRASDIFAGFIRSEKDKDKNLYEKTTINAALLNMAADDIQSVSVTLLPLDTKTLQYENSKRFIAEYSYDFANPVLAAELWSSLTNEHDIARAADAFVLADDIEGAKYLWLLLTLKTSNENTPPTTSRLHEESGLPIVKQISESVHQLRTRCFYNLASVSADISDKRNYLQQLFMAEAATDLNTSSYIFAVIAWSRILEDDIAIPFLQNILENRLPLVSENQMSTQFVGIVDLELFRRNIKTIPVNKSIADTWLLLNRHSYDTNIYNWAAWYFEFMRRNEDLVSLKHFASQHKVDSPQLMFVDALDLIVSDHKAAALKLLSDLQNDGYKNWAHSANAGLIYEAQRQYTAALGEYSNAIQVIELRIKKIPEHDAARVFLRAAHCYAILGNKELQRSHLERALEIAPNNVEVKLQLKKT